MAKKCNKDWASDPRMWFALAVVSGVATAVATAYVSRAMNLKAEALRAQIARAGLTPEA